MQTNDLIFFYKVPPTLKPCGPQLIHLKTKCRQPEMGVAKNQRGGLLVLFNTPARNQGVIVGSEISQVSLSTNAQFIRLSVNINSTFLPVQGHLAL